LGIAVHGDAAHYNLVASHRTYGCNHCGRVAICFGWFWQYLHFHCNYKCIATMLIERVDSLQWMPTLRKYAKPTNLSVLPEGLASLSMEL
jgi:hypothetical protein